MPWRVKTLTEYRTSGSASPDSEDKGLDLFGTQGGVETSDVLASGHSCDENGFVQDDCLRMDRFQMCL